MTHHLRNVTQVRYGRDPWATPYIDRVQFYVSDSTAPIAETDADVARFCYCLLFPPMHARLSLL